MSLQVSSGGGKGGNMGYWMRRGSGWGKGGFYDQPGSWIKSENTVQGDTPGSPQFGLRLVVPKGHLALTRQKGAPDFGNPPIRTPFGELGLNWSQKKKLIARFGRQKLVKMGFWMNGRWERLKRGILGGV